MIFWSLWSVLYLHSLSSLLLFFFSFLILGLRHFLLVFNITLVTVFLRLVVFNLDSVLHFFSFDIAKLLRFDNVRKVTSVTVRLQFIKQVKLMLFQFLNTCVETAYRLEHFVMLCLELGHIVLALNNLLIKGANLIAESIVFVFLVVQELLHVSSGSNCLLSKSLLPHQFISEVVTFTYQCEVILLVLGHFSHSLVFVMLILLSLNGLRTEHPRKQFGIVPDPLELVVNFLLKVLGFLQLWNVVILVLVCLFLDISNLFL